MNSKYTIKEFVDTMIGSVHPVGAHFADQVALECLLEKIQLTEALISDIRKVTKVKSDGVESIQNCIDVAKKFLREVKEEIK